MPEIKQVALVGAGAMASYHVRGFRAAGAEVAAVVDTSPERGKAFAARWQIPDVCGSLGELSRKHPGVGAVSIIVPNRFHRPLVLEAIERGFHVFCEKPPALNAAETAEMTAAAARRQRQLMFNFNNRARLDAGFVKQEIDAGRLGRINSVQAVWRRRTGIPGFGGWFTRRELAGGGPLIDLLHMIDLALWFMDYPEPEWVLAQCFDDFINDPDFKGPWGAFSGSSGTNDVESSCHGFVRFRSGQVMTFHNSWAEMIKHEDTFVALQGTRGGVLLRSVNDHHDCEFYAQENGVSVDRNYRFPDDCDMGRTRAPENFIRVLNHGAEPLTAPSEALTLMRLIDAAYRSAAAGRPVNMNDV